MKKSVDEVIDQNVQALIDLRKKHESARRPTERALDFVVAFFGSAAFIYVQLALLALWGIFRPFSFDTLADCASVEALFLAALLLGSQNRARAHEQRREDLDLQVSLLIEHELTRLGRVCDHIATKVGAGAEAKREKGGLTEDIPATKVLERIEAVEEKNEK